jgi:hypothetical protein
LLALGRVAALRTLQPPRSPRYQDFASIARCGIWKFRRHAAANAVLRCGRINSNESNQENTSCVRFDPFSCWPCRSRAWQLPAISTVPFR